LVTPVTGNRSIGGNVSRTSLTISLIPRVPISSVMRGTFERISKPIPEVTIVEKARATVTEPTSGS
jgi:hypothetical protein